MVCNAHIMKNIFAIFVLITISILTTDLKAEAKQVNNKDSKIILHDGMFGNGLPNRFNIDLSKKNGRWGYGNWESSQGYANIGFSQTGQGRIILETGMIPKKILKSWSVENYKLGKKKGFKSSGNRALVQLVDINNKKCVVIISRFGPSGGDAQNRLRSTVDGYICKNSGEISIDEGINFMHCTELKGEGTNFIGRKIDDKCVKKTTEKKIEKESSSTSTTSKKSIQKNNKDSLEERLKKLKSLYEKNLITKEEYDLKRKEILDEM